MNHSFVAGKNKNKIRIGNITFDIVLVLLLLLFCVIILYPFLNVVAISLSSSAAITRGDVGIIPIELTLKGYEIVFSKSTVYVAYGWTIWYAFLSTVLSVSLTACLGYALSVPGFVLNKLFSTMLLITMFFGGGTVPSYLNIKNLGLMDTTWALVLPGCLSVYNMIVMRTYFSGQIPDELHEAAMLDGCGDMRFLVQIVLPLSGPILAVIALYYSVNMWNAYFSAMVYISTRSKLPLPNFLREILLLNMVNSMEGNLQDLENIAKMEQRAELMKYSLIIVASLPVMMIYPFVQRYFVKGVMIGAVKG